MNKVKAVDKLIAFVIDRQGTDITVEDIYRVTCKPPHQELLTNAQLHCRVSRYIGEARRLLRPKGYVLIPGQARHSYRAVVYGVKKG